MAALSSSTAKTLTLTTSDLFLSSYESFSCQTPPPNPPLRPLALLSQNSPLPPIPSDFPASKLIPKTRFVVDGFKLAGDFSISYFLSHFHSDHYAGLNPNWCNGLIFCSEITSRLLVESLKVSSHFVVSLAVGETVKIDEREVTLVDANHCPGAVQFLIRVPVIDGPDERYVHTGDFRFCDSMKLDSSLREFVGADAVFLDTTYCNPKFVFPSQEESIDYIVNAIKRIRTENEGATSSVLFLIATYVVGKERILLEVARRCNCLVHADVKKMAILCTLGFGDSGFFTEDVLASDVDVISWNLLGETWPYFRPNFVKMEEIMVERGFSRAVGFVPTGWTYRAKKEGFAVRAKGSLEIHLVPYSEHSSYSELREYVSFLRPKQVIPTVGLDIENLDSKHVIAMRKHFVGLVNETANKHDFLKVFYSRSSDTNGTDREGVEIDSNQGGDTKGVSLECLEVNLESGFDVEFVPSVQKDSSAEKDEGREEIVQEIRDCLPVWVTRDQMLDLLKRSGGDIVEAVSDFYERETELHEQVKTRNISVSRAEIGSMSESASNPGFRSAKDTTPGESILSQEDKKSGNLNLLTNTLSPRKRGAKFDKKVKKKSRPISALDASGCKQSTITKFFGKVTHDASQVTSTCNSITVTDQCRTDGSNLHCEDVESYKEEMDQFQQILNGSVSRKHAATLLEKANGDVNLALDMYYSNSVVVLGSVDESLKTNNEPLPIQSDVINDCCTEKGIANISNSSVLGPSTEDLNATYTSLPLEKYSPVEHACWRAGQPAPYLHLARTFDLVEHEKSKIKATGMLCNMFRSLLALSPKDVLPAMYLCTNKIAADHENMELNIGSSLVSAALEEACGTNKSKIRDMYNNLGDLGDVAQVCRQTQSLLAAPRPISIQQLFSILRKISVESGNGSTARKKNLVVNLMRSCREKEIKFLVRTLVRNLRIGAMMKTVLPALAQAVVLNTSPQLLEGVVERLKEQFQSISGAVVEAFHILPNLDLLVPSLLTKGIDFSSTTLSMTPGIPIRPMLARITNGVNQALALFQGRAFTCEFKYDGQRAQIHKLADGSIQVFSRSGEESTSRFPDLVNMIKESCKPDSKTFVLDAEVVAVDRKNRNKLMAFQQLCSRERGSKDSSIAVNSIKIEICVFIFDIMFLNGEKLLTYTLRQRRKYLEDLFLDEKLGYLEFAKQITVEADEACLTVQTTLTKLSSFLEDAFNSSCEGIIVKSLDDGGYAASKRSNTWLKVKRDYLEGLSDTLDLVPIGAWHGNGRKAGWYSPFLMACYNPDTEEFQSVCRVMSGFSDSFYVEMKEFFSDEKILSRKPPYYQTGEEPDVWFSSELVWAIRGADFTISPVHQAAVGLVHPSRGISIRFPRFIRSVTDRKPEDCCNAGDIADMFRSQNRKMDVSIDN